MQGISKALEKQSFSFGFGNQRFPKPRKAKAFLMFWKRSFQSPEKPKLFLCSEKQKFFRAKKNQCFSYVLDFVNI